ncbi:ABC transporter substrate-binding protein [Paracoccus sp. (in: a-proteobacteria)]|uniref:ABC transporter substrate-binding protein n=1 Tax=Paracoccus sp. TaxID=267 RepID=UPI003A835FCF
MRHSFVSLVAVTAAAVMPTFASSQENAVEVLHFFTSGSEAAAFYSYKDAFESAGGTWVDSPVAGGGGDSHDTTLRARVLAGDGPGAAMPKCPETSRWYQEGYIVDLDDVAADQKWDEILPTLLQDFAKADGHYTCVPFDIHRIDWLWGNAAVLAEAGIGGMPQTWEEFDAAAQKITDAGKIVLAAGGQEWQDGTIYQGVALAIGGADYLKAIAAGDPAAIDTDTSRQVFDRMRILSTYVDRGYPGRDWNLATAMVSNGEAAFQIMGDWAKGEFIQAGATMGEDILCAPVPGNVPDRPGMIMVSNALGFFTKEKGNAEATEGQKLLAATLLNEDAEIAYTLHKGSVPARLGVPLEQYDSCAVKSMSDLKVNNDAGTLVGDIYTMQPFDPAIAAAVRQVASQHFNMPDMTSDEAVQLMLESVELVR